MHIVSDSGGLQALNAREEKLFIDLYKMSPDEFMEKYDTEYSIDDLHNTIIISVESRVSPPKVIEDVKYCVNILDVYTPKEGQRAALNYCGHIAFVEVSSKSGERIALLYKNDECFPQSFNEWYDEFIINEDEEGSKGVIPTKVQVLEIVKAMIRGYCQDPDLNVGISENNVIVLQGL